MSDSLVDENQRLKRLISLEERISEIYRRMACSERDRVDALLMRNAALERENTILKEKLAAKEKPVDPQYHHTY